MAEYKLLEPDIAPAFGVTAPTFTGTPTLFASSSFIFALSITIVIVAASFRYAYAGVLRLPASEEGIRKSKEEFRRVTYGLLGVLGLWLVLFTVNKDMLTGEVTLSALKSSGGGGGAGALTQTVPTTVPITNPTVTNPGSGGSSKLCTMDEKTTIAALDNNNICGSTSCTALSGCNYQPYLSILKSKANGDTLKLKMLIVILCKESKGKEREQGINKNEAGVITSYDCGLMQVSQKTACLDGDYEPNNNISKGSSILFGLLGAKVYQNIPAPLSIFASYNAGPGSNSNSADCTSANGFKDGSIPKWACPVNAGDMCAVKNYACDLNACLSSPSLNNL